MPKIVERLVRQLQAKGFNSSKARAIAVGTLQKNKVLKKNSLELTEKGKKRNSMTAAERAKSRASKQSGKPTKSYKYNKKTNKAVLKK